MKKINVKLKKNVAALLLIISGFISNAQVASIDSYTDILHILNNKELYPNYTLVAGHRGYWADTSENTVSSYDALIEISADFIEMDVRLSSDNHPIILHDACLQRLTNGGKRPLRELTLVEAQALVYKKLNTNILTDQHVLSLNDALTHLNGKTVMVNLDIKEIGNDYAVAFKASVAVAQELEVLDQITLKGGLQISEVQAILEELGLTFEDINYIPVLYGSKVDLEQRVEDIMTIVDQGHIHAVELHFKDDLDPLIKHIQPFKDKNVWVGIFGFWPEECAGVQAEIKPANLCEFETRRYNFKNNGNLKDSTNDGRGDWDWMFSHGVDYMITERPKLMIDYLDILDKRTL